MIKFPNVLKTLLKTTCVLGAVVLAYSQCLAKAQSTSTIKPAYHKRFTNANEWTKVFDDSARDEWQKPNAVIKALDIKDNDRIADIGAGTGYFSARIAKAYPKATVYAVDFENDMIKFLNKLAKHEKLTNLKAIKTNMNKLELPEPVDIVIIVDTYHHIDKRIEYLKNLKTCLNLQAKVVDIDFNQSSPMGPPLKHRLSEVEVINEFKQAGFKLIAKETFLPNQYFLIFQ